MTRGRPPLVWGEAKRTRFRQMWALGRSVAYIADELGVSQTALKKMRVKMKLPPRRLARGDWSRAVKVQFTAAQWDKIHALAKENGFTVAKTVRLAIERFTRGL